MQHQSVHTQLKITLEQAEVVDIIFLDIDGVLLPFGDDSSCGGDTSAHGCIFPNSTMESLTSLLYKMTDFKLPLNSQLCKGNPKIVLSSTWRAQPAFIKDILSSFQCYANANPSTKDLWKMHADNFFSIVDPNFHSTRHDEIYSWIKRHVDGNTYDHKTQCKKTQTHTAANKDFIVRSWIALDDEELVHVSDAYPDTDKHAIKTQSSVGLTKADVDLAMHLVKEQITDFSEVK